WRARAGHPVLPGLAALRPPPQRPRDRGLQGLRRALRQALALLVVRLRVLGLGAHAPGAVEGGDLGVGGASLLRQQPRRGQGAVLAGLRPRAAWRARARARAPRSAARALLADLL